MAMIHMDLVASGLCCGLRRIFCCGALASLVAACGLRPGAPVPGCRFVAPWHGISAPDQRDRTWVPALEVGFLTTGPKEALPEPPLGHLLQSHKLPETRRQACPVALPPSSPPLETASAPVPQVQGHCREVAYPRQGAASHGGPILLRACGCSPCKPTIHPTTIATGAQVTLVLAELSLFLSEGSRTSV